MRFGVRALSRGAQASGPAAAQRSPCPRAVLLARFAFAAALAGLPGVTGCAGGADPIREQPAANSASTSVSSTSAPHDRATTTGAATPSGSAPPLPGSAELAASAQAPAGNELAASAHAPAGSAAPAASAAPSGEATTIGDQTCTRNEDCTLTRRNNCCDCCQGPVMATSKAWLRWRDGACTRERCEPCGKVKCPFFPPADAFVARCERGRCQRATR